MELEPAPFAVVSLLHSLREPVLKITLGHPVPPKERKKTNKSTEEAGDLGHLSDIPSLWIKLLGCKTVITNDYMQESFSVTVESFHVDGDRGQLENALNLTPEKLKQREVVTIDVAKDAQSYYLQTFNAAKEDVTRSFSQKALRGPLQGDWAKTCDPVMTCYKLVSIEFKWYGLQTTMESYMHSIERDLFTKFHRELFCSMDQWHGLTMESIREMEKRTKEELDDKFATHAATTAAAK